ncbi:MAG TPA: hypothetical protein ENJ84_05640 [Gammaproteobacteria bacterium]|nr:hypothetical protein [Gammaproteobacteria bacterium]
MALRSLIFGIFSLCLAGPASAQPQALHVTLQEFTRLTLEVVPDLGTQLVFPFALDGNMTPPLEINNTNKIGFSYSHTSGQNTILITANTLEQGGSLPDYRGLLFVSIGGYHLSIDLRTTTRLSRHYAEVVFDLEPPARNHLIAHAVQRKRDELEQRYQQRLAALDEQAARLALAMAGELAETRPKIRRVKSARRVPLANDVMLELYADHWKIYPSLAVLVFEVKNESPRRVVITNSYLETAAGDGQKNLPESSYRCRGALRGDDYITCTLTIRDPASVDAKLLKLVLETDRGRVALSW